LALTVKWEDRFGHSLNSGQNTICRQSFVNLVPDSFSPDRGQKLIEVS
jgi:hypothetical protein